MGFFGNLLYGMSVKASRKEMQEIVNLLKGMDYDEIEFLVEAMFNFSQSMLNEALLLGGNRVGFDLMHPHGMVDADSQCIVRFKDMITQMQRQGEVHSAAACMPWLHTLRAAFYPELRGLCREMWKELARGMNDPVATDFPEGFTPEPL